MDPADTATRDRPSLTPAVWPVAVGGVVLLFLLDTGIGSVAALGAAACLAYRARMWWLAACAAAWALVFLAVLVFPGPYDSWAGRAVLPVLALYTLIFLGGWALGRKVGAGRAPDGGPARARPELSWPSEPRLRAFLLIMLAIGVTAAVARFWGAVPPLLADNPDVAREALSHRNNIATGLMSEAWTLGMAVSLLRVLTGGRQARLVYLAATAVFTVGAALGASKNSVLVGIVPAVVAALSVRRPQRQAKPLVKTRYIVLVGALAVGLAVFLGGQRTLAGTGVFEDEFRARYGNNVVAASVASLDLSLSSSSETFGRLWAQRDEVERRYGAYSLTFLGSPGERLFGEADLYATTAQLSMPYYMNTATFVAIPLLDFGPIGAGLVLLALGLCVGLAERRLEFSAGPAQQVGRAFIVYYAAFGVYELYPAIQPIWLGLVPGLLLLYLMGRRTRA